MTTRSHLADTCRRQMALQHVQPQHSTITIQAIQAPRAPPSVPKRNMHGITTSHFTVLRTREHVAPARERKHEVSGNNQHPRNYEYVQPELGSAVPSPHGWHENSHHRVNTRAQPVRLQEPHIRTSSTAQGGRQTPFTIDNHQNTSRVANHGFVSVIS